MRKLFFFFLTATLISSCSGYMEGIYRKTIQGTDVNKAEAQDTDKKTFKVECAPGFQMSQGNVPYDAITYSLIEFGTLTGKEAKFHRIARASNQ